MMAFLGAAILILGPGVVVCCWRVERASSRRYRAYEEAHRVWMSDPTDVDKYRAFIRACRAR